MRNSIPTLLRQPKKIPMMNPEVKAEPTTTEPRNEEHGRRIYITGKMVSEFGATLDCKGCSMIGQPHTEECRARITARMESDPLHAKRLEDNLNSRNELANPETTITTSSESKTDTAKRARQGNVEAPQESVNIGGVSSSSAQADVDMRVIHAGKRPLDFIIAGDGDDLGWLSQKLSEKLELVQKARLGLGHDNKATVLNRCVMYGNSGLTWEADPRHAELAVAELGLQAARPQTSPGGLKVNAPLDHQEPEPDGQKAYHSVSARLSYLAALHPLARSAV